MDARPRGLLVSERFLAHHGDALDAAEREGGLAVERIVVPDDPEGRVDAAALARIGLRVVGVRRDVARGGVVDEPA